MDLGKTVVWAMARDKVVVEVEAETTADHSPLVAIAYAQNVVKKYRINRV
jgi:hypothetical protein